MKPFKPQQLPLKDLNWSGFIDLIGTANRYIARYDGLLQSVVNPDILLSPLKTKEAVLSSRIEGTQATLEEVFEYESERRKVEETKKRDIDEIINYRIALQKGRRKMDDKPLSLNMIRELHKILMKGVRDFHKNPGEFRKIQNWIGPPGSTMDNARYIPPDLQSMKKALYNWEKYIHFNDKDILVQLAVIHAQFEIIHPFLDGNGRIGRILIPLFLYHKEAIRDPVFYMSDYLENHRQEYYDSLKDITDSNNWQNWIRFFLKGMISQAEKNIIQTREIIELYESMKRQMTKKMHSQYLIHCLDFIYSKPIFNTSEFRNNSLIPNASASRLIKSMQKAGMIKLVEKGAGRKPALYEVNQLMNIINK